MSSDFRRLPKHFGDAVRELRKTSGLSQMALAEKAGLSLNYVGEVERGEKLVSLETIVRLAKALDVSGGELLNKAKI